MSKYAVFSGPYFMVFGLNTGKYGPEKAPYLDNFYAVLEMGWFVITQLLKTDFALTDDL